MTRLRILLLIGLIPGLVMATAAPAGYARSRQDARRSSSQSAATTTVTGTATAPSGMTFRYTGGLGPHGRVSAAVLLVDGRILLTGVDGEYARAELYDPATGGVTATGSMTQGREHYTATLLQNGKVLIAGGTLTGLGYGFANAELYDPTTGTFTTTGNLRQGRWGHTATLLQDGKVLIAGGTGPTSVATAELYDPATGTFSATGSIHDGRYFQTATLLQDGTVLFVGGTIGVPNPVATAELYDPVVGTFSRTFNPQHARWGHTATLLPDGKVLIAGGAEPYTDSSATAELYDPATRTFSATGNMTRVRFGHTATLLGSGKVLIAGGGGSTAELYEPATGTFTATGSMKIGGTGLIAILLHNWNVLIAGSNEIGYELYNPTTGTFTHSLIVPSSYHTATLLGNGKVLIAGGYGNGNTAALYDPATWTITATGSMTRGRYQHTATRLPNGKVLIAGGTAIGNGGGFASAELYDPAIGTFTVTGSMTQPRYRHTATLLGNGKVLIVGGFGSWNTAEIYDPATGTFSATGSMMHRRYLQTATTLPNGKVLIAGGQGVDGDLYTGAATAELYDPATGTFSTTGSMHDGRYLHTATLLPDGKVLIAGGETRTNERFVSLATAELYDPTTGTFSTTGSMTLTRQEHTATVLQDGRVLIAGGKGVSRLGTGVLKTAEVYDTPTGIFVPSNSLLQTMADHTAIRLPNGKVFLVGGPEPELGTLLPHNTFTGTLTLPDGWIGATTPLNFSGTSDAAPVTAGAIGDAASMGPWIGAVPGRTVTTTWKLTSEGRDHPVVLRLRDANGISTRVVSTTVDIDLTAPQSLMFGLPAQSPPTFTVSWLGKDALSGVASYDVEVAGGDGVWTPLLTATTARSTNFSGAPGTTYVFRVRARDVVGNVEAWRSRPDTTTTVRGAALNRQVYLPLVRR